MFDLILGKCQWDPDPEPDLSDFLDPDPFDLLDPDPAENGPDPQPCSMNDGRVPYLLNPLKDYRYRTVGTGTVPVPNCLQCCTVAETI
jgi:hypothetical protein